MEAVISLMSVAPMFEQRVEMRGVSRDVRWSARACSLCALSNRLEGASDDVCRSTGE